MRFKEKIAYIIPAIILVALFAHVAEAVVIIPPALDFIGSWTYIHSVKVTGKTIYVRELSFTDLIVTVSVPLIGEYYLNDTPGVEEIIDAAVNIDTLVRDADNNWLFSSGSFSIEENGNTYLSADLSNVTFEPDGVSAFISWLNPDMDMDDLINLDTSANTRPSRFIEVLNTEIAGTGLDYTNMRLQLSVLDGTNDFTEDSYGNVAGKIMGIPEPASAGLFIMGVTAIAGILKRKTSRREFSQIAQENE